MINFSVLNYGIIFATTVLTFAIGMLWYTALFGKSWQKETGVTDQQMKDISPAMTYGGSFVCFLLLNVFLAGLLKTTNITSWMEGAMLGFQVGLLVNVASLTINYLYQYKSMKLWLIDSGYQLLIMTVAGVVMSVWR